VTAVVNYSIKSDYSITLLLHLCNQIPRNKDRHIITKYYIRTGHLIYNVSVNSLLSLQCNDTRNKYTPCKKCLHQIYGAVMSAPSAHHNSSIAATVHSNKIVRVQSSAVAAKNKYGSIRNDAGTVPDLATWRTHEQNPIPVLLYFRIQPRWQHIGSHL